MKLLPALVTTTALLAKPLTVNAQQALAAQPGTQTDSVLKHWLRSLVVSQEHYYSEHGTYTTDVSALGLFTPPRQPAVNAKPDSIYLEVIQAGGRSWWGRGSLRGHRGKSCIVWVGTMTDFPAPPTTDGSKAPGGKEGEPTCDQF
jgi:hypothetical protein